MSIEKLNGLRLSRMIIAGANELTANKQIVDAMNVFPVPDGDTGTNMSLTVLAAARETEKGTSLHVDEIAKLASSGALRGARGNSGVITSQLFRGFAKSLEGHSEVGTKELALATDNAVKTAYKAVMKPKEGTILTVARACAESAAWLAEETDDIEVFLKGILEHAHSVLLKTPDMLPVLKQAGVVDAGGRGLLYVLEGALKHIDGDTPITIAEPSKKQEIDMSALAMIQTEEITFGYCTEFFINVKHVEEPAVQKLKAFLGTMGDSLVCVSDDDIVKIHVHTDHPGLVIEKAMEMGSLSGLKIDNMREQHTSIIDFSQKEEVPVAVAEEMPHKEIGFVAIAAGDGIAEIFRNLGVDVVIEGGQTMNPSTEDILNAVEKINADSVVVFPNNKNIILAAEQAVELCTDKKLYVVPSRSIPEGISAKFCDAEGVGAEELVEEMKEAIEAVSTVTVTYAVRDTVFGEKTIAEGDILCMLDDEIKVVAKDVKEGTKQLLSETITEDSEIVGIYYGTDVSKEDAEEMGAYIEEMYPDCEVEIQYGGQPLYYYIISIE